jgi:thiamine monophosphate kinase
MAVTFANVAPNVISADTDDSPLGSVVCAQTSTTNVALFRRKFSDVGSVVVMSEALGDASATS